MILITFTHLNMFVYIEKRLPHGPVLLLVYCHQDAHVFSSQGRGNLTRRLDGGPCKKMLHHLLNLAKQVDYIKITA